MSKPKLVSNAKAVVKHSWSFWLNAIATVASSIVLGMSVLAGAPPINPVWFAAGYGLMNLFAAGARFIAQAEVSGDQA